MVHVSPKLFAITSLYNLGGYHLLIIRGGGVEIMKQKPCKC